MQQIATEDSKPIGALYRNYLKNHLSQNKYFNEQNVRLDEWNNLLIECFTVSGLDLKIYWLMQQIATEESKPIGALYRNYLKNHLSQNKYFNGQNVRLDEWNNLSIENFTVARLDPKIQWLMQQIATEDCKPIGALYRNYLNNHWSQNKYVNGQNVRLDDRNNLLIECFTVSGLDLKIYWLMQQIATEDSKPIGALYRNYLKNHLSQNKYFNGQNVRLDEWNNLLIENFTVARLDPKIQWLMQQIATEDCKPIGALYLNYLNNHWSQNKYENGQNVRLDERNNLLIECSLYQAWISRYSG